MNRVIRINRLSWISVKLSNEDNSAFLSVLYLKRCFLVHLCLDSHYSKNSWNSTWLTQNKSWTQAAVEAKYDFIHVELGMHHHAAWTSSCLDQLHKSGYFINLSTVNVVIMKFYDSRYSAHLYFFFSDAVQEKKLSSETQECITWFRRCVMKKSYAFLLDFSHDDNWRMNERKWIGFLAFPLNAMYLQWTKPVTR